MDLKPPFWDPKSKIFYGRGILLTPHPLGACAASIVAPTALDLGAFGAISLPPFSNPGSATAYKSTHLFISAPSYCHSNSYVQAFIIGGQTIELVDSWRHLGHDCDDVSTTKCSFMGQTNYMFVIVVGWLCSRPTFSRATTLLHLNQIAAL